MAKKGKRPKPSQGGRTASEAGLAASMAAAGKKVSRTNLNVARGYSVPSGVTQVTSGSGYTTRGGIVSKRKPRVTKKGARVADRVFGTPNLTGRLTVASKQAENRAKRAAQGKPVRSQDSRGSGLKKPRKRAPQNRVAASNRQVGRIEAKISSVRRGTDSDPFLLSPSRLSQMPTSTRPKKQELRRLNRRLNRAKDKRADRVAARRVNRTLKQVRNQFLKEADPAKRQAFMRDWKRQTKTQRQRNEMLAAFYATDDKARAENEGAFRTVAKTTRDAQGNKIGAKQVKQLNTRYRQGTSKEDLEYNLRLMREDVLGSKSRRAVLPTEQAARKEMKEQQQGVGEAVADFVTEGIPEVGADLQDLAQSPERIARQAARDVSRTGVPGAALLPFAVEAITGEELGVTPGSDEGALATEMDYVNVALTALAAGKIGQGALKSGKVYQAMRARNAAPRSVFTVGPGGAGTTVREAGRTVSKESAAMYALRGTKTIKRSGQALGVANRARNSKIYKVGRGMVGVGIVGASIAKWDWTVAAIKGTSEALIDDPIQTLETTARGLISGVTSPVVILANMGMAARTGNTKPLEYMADAFYKEGEALFHVYTSGDADIVKEATIEDYGLINLMGGLWLTRPIWATLPSKATSVLTKRIPSGLADGASLNDRWNEWRAARRAANETTVIFDRLNSAKDRDFRERERRILQKGRKLNNGAKGKKLNAALENAFRREVEINKDALAETLLNDRELNGDNPATARELLSDPKLTKQAEQMAGGEPLSIVDLAVFMQTRDAPMTYDRQWIRDEMEAANMTPDMVQLRALEMASELYEDPQLADLFRSLRSEIRVVSNEARAYRDEVMGTSSISRPEDQETALAIERAGMAPEIDENGQIVVRPGGVRDKMGFVGGVNPFRVDEDGVERLERPEVRAKEQIETELANATRYGNESRQSRQKARGLTQEINKAEAVLAKLREADVKRPGNRKKRKASEETAAEARYRRSREKLIADASKDIEDFAPLIARGGDLGKIRQEIKKLVKKAEADHARLQRSMERMERRNPDAAEVLSGSQTWTKLETGKSESDLGYRVEREDLSDAVAGGSDRAWLAIAPDGSVIGRAKREYLAKELTADHRAINPKAGETAIAGSFQRDEGGTSLASEMRRPQIQEEYGLFVADLTKRLKASRGTDGKRGRILEHRYQDGFWDGGSEPSFASLLSISDPKVVRSIAAAIGYHFEQDSMAVFRPDAKGRDGVLELTLKDNLDRADVDAALRSMADEDGNSPGGSKLGNKAYFYVVDIDDPDAPYAPQAYLDAFSDLTEGESSLRRGHVDFIDRDVYQETIEEIPEVAAAARSYGERWGGRTYTAGSRTSLSEEAERALPAREGGAAGPAVTNPEDEVGFYRAEINRLQKEAELLEAARTQAKEKVEAATEKRRILISELRNRKNTRRSKIRNYKPDYRIAAKESEIERLINERDALRERASQTALAREEIIERVRGRLTKEELDAQVAAALSILNIDEVRLRSLSPEEAARKTAELTADRDKIIARRKADENRRQELFDGAKEKDVDELLRLDEVINESYIREGVFDMLIQERMLQTLTAGEAELIHAAAQAARRDKQAEYEQRLTGLFNTFYQQQLENYRTIVGAEGAAFIPNKPKPNDILGSASPSFPQGLAGRKDRFRTGQQGRAGDVDRSADAFFNYLEESGTLIRNRKATEYVLAKHAFEYDFGLGPQKAFVGSEIELLQRRGVEMGDLLRVNTRLFSSPNHLFQIMAEKREGGTQATLDKAVEQLDKDIDKSIAEIEDPKVRAEATRQRAIVLAQEGKGQKYYLVKKPVIERLFKEERINSSKLYAGSAKLNTVVHRAVLGTSFAWLFAQPIAEWMIWAADNPTAAAKFMQYRVRRAQAIAEDPQAARRLSYFGATTLGTDSATSRSAKALQSETSEAIRLAKQTDMGYLWEEIYKVKALGNLDRMKGAAIREFAVLAEIDRNLSTLGRSAKAVKGQMDEIEKVADKLKTMTDAERLRFLDSEEGRAAGEQIMKHIDESLGNWSALSPTEKPLASVVFFYPFVRFSMNWVLRTYPKNHPVRWTLATVLGQMNSEIMEEYLKADPTYSSGWAAIPIWGADSPVPMALLQLNRIALGGNSFFEFLGDRDANLISLITNTLNPGIGIPLMALAGRDRYGNPLENKDGQIFGGDVSAADQLREAAASFARLSPISREFLRYHSLHIEGPFGSPSFVPKATWAGDEVRKRQPGDDLNKMRDGMRRLVLPFAIPEDLDDVSARYQVNDLWERYGAAIEYSSKSYSEKAARARKQVEDEQRWLSENDERSWSAGWHRRNLALSEYKRTSPDYAQYLREWGTKQEAEDEADKIALALARIYRQTGAPMPESEGFLERINKPKRERLDVKERWESLNAGMMYPGYKQAQKELKLYDSGGVTKGRKVNIKSVYSSDDRVGVSVVKQLKTSSRKAMGGRGNVSNPLDDPRTKTVEKGKQTLVTNYRGKEVVGDLTLKEVRAAERNGTIGIDDDGKITTPKTRQLVARVEGVGEQAANLLDQAAKWEGQSGGRINLPGDEGLFINELARQTGMDARVLAAWTKSEGGNSFGDYNLLNIGHTGSGPNSAASNADFSTPKSAAAATAAFLRGEWGGPGAGIPQIIDNAKGKSPAEQIRVIEQSGWRLGSIGPDPGYAKLITDVYNEQPPTLPANPKAKQALKALEPQIKAARKAYSKVAEEARAMGIEVDPLQEPGPVGTVSWGPKKARQIDGAWGGTMRILSRANRGDFTISSEKRTPEQNASVGGSSMSDHLTTNTNSYAHDIPAVGDDQGIPIAEAYHKRLKLNEPLAIGTYNNYTSRKYPGYTFQILWNVSGHYDHVHVGARYTGEDLPAGTYSGGPAGTSVGGALPVGGGGGAMPASGGGGGPMPELKFADLAKGFGGIESGNLPSVAEEVAAASGNTGGDGVKSVAEQLAKLPKTRKKQTLPKFDPTTRI